MTKPLPTIERLHELLDYDPETGQLTWRVRRGRQTPGKRAGGINGIGYVLVAIDRNQIGAHRVIWAMVHGVWPPHDIDHINGCTADNRLVNLRLATRAQNNANMPLNRKNTSGYRGVIWCKQTGKWAAQIGRNGSTAKLGRFATKEEAAEVYQRAARELWGEFLPR